MFCITYVVNEMYCYILLSQWLLNELSSVLWYLFVSCKRKILHIGHLLDGWAIGMPDAHHHALNVATLLCTRLTRGECALMFLSSLLGATCERAYIICMRAV